MLLRYGYHRHHESTICIAPLPSRLFLDQRSPATTTHHVHHVVNRADCSRDLAMDRPDCSKWQGSTRARPGARVYSCCTVSLSNLLNYIVIGLAFGYSAP